MKILILSLLAVSCIYADGFEDFYKKFGDLKVNKGYEITNKKMKQLAKEYGYYATFQEVKDAIEGKKLNGKKVVVVDSRTKKEQHGLKLKGAIYANLRGWNKSFNNEKLHSNNISAVYNYCRSGTDVAGGIVTLEWLFQGKGKIFGLKDMVERCYPVVSDSKNVLDAKLNQEGIYVQKDKNNNYYEANCPQVKDECSPIAVFTKLDIEMVEEDDDEKLPKTFKVTNKYLKKTIKLHLGKDNLYYKRGCR